MMKQMYGRAMVTRTLKGNEKQFKLADVQVISVGWFPSCHVNNMIVY